MNELKLTKQFKKDLKRYKHQLEVIAKLEVILDLLQEERSIPKENKPHELKGGYRGHMECHVENGSLLIWWDKVSGVISLVRFGSHSELFD